MNNKPDLTKIKPQWPTVAIIGILAALVALGHNGEIELALLGIVLGYLGLDLTILHKWRK